LARERSWNAAFSAEDTQVTLPVDHVDGTSIAQQRLEVPLLVARLIALLDSAAHLVAQIPADALHARIPGRERTYLDLAWHLPQVVVGFLDAALDGHLAHEHVERRPPDSWRTADDAAGFVRSVSQALAVWWAANQSRLPVSLETDRGRQEFYAALERTTGDVAQHARQLERVLELRGIRPVPPLPQTLLAGLHLPHDMWGAELPPG
jgi:hypothetical protein